MKTLKAIQLVSKSHRENYEWLYCVFCKSEY